MKKMLMTLFLVFTFAGVNCFAEEESCMVLFSEDGVQAMTLKLAMGDYRIGGRKPKLTDLMEWAAICGWVSEMNKEENKETAKELDANVKLTKEVDQYIVGLGVYVLTGEISTNDDIVLCQVNKKIQDDMAFDKVPSQMWTNANLMGQPKTIPMGKKNCLLYESAFELFR